MKLCTIIILLAFILIGCGPKFTEGIITEKQFIPAHAELIFYYNAALKQSMPMYQFIEDQYYLVITDGEGNYEKFHVSQSIFQQQEIGNYYQQTTNLPRSRGNQY